MMNFTKNDIKPWYYALLFLICIGFDRITKYWAVTLLGKTHQQLTSFLNLALSWNRGISWSMFSHVSGYERIALMIFIAMVLSGLTWYTFLRHQKDHPIIPELMVIAGALSNIIDRCIYGAVVDFIDFHIGLWHWPTFNVADIFIVIGVLGMLIFNLRKNYA